MRLEAANQHRDWLKWRSAWMLTTKPPGDRIRGRLRDPRPREQALLLEQAEDEEKLVRLLEKHLLYLPFQVPSGELRLPGPFRRVVIPQPTTP